MRRRQIREVQFSHYTSLAVQGMSEREMNDFTLPFEDLSRASNQVDPTKILGWRLFIKMFHKYVDAFQRGRSLFSYESLLNLSLRRAP